MNGLAVSSAALASPCAGRLRTGTDGLTLRDGRRVTLRPVAPADADAEQRFFSTLSPRSRLRRFHGAVNELPASVLRALTEVDPNDHVALVAQADTDDGLPVLVADARFVIDADDRARAEFAIAVADDWQRQGLARALLVRLARQACERGVTHLEGSVLAGNEPMLALMREVGATLQLAANDASVVEVAFSF